MDQMLELVSDNEKLAVFKHLCKTPLDVALNPEFALCHAYYTVTKGPYHVFTIVKQDGSTWSFEFGKGGATLISQSTSNLKVRVFAFALENGILMDLTSAPKKAEAWRESDYYGKSSWTIAFEDSSGERQLIRGNASLEEAKALAEKLAGKKLKWETRGPHNPDNAIWTAYL